MPVVGCHDADDIDVVPLQNLAIVAVSVGFAFSNLVVVAGSIGVIRVHIANGQDVTEARVLTGVAGSHTAHTDAANAWSRVGFVVSEGGSTPRKIRN